MNEDASTSLQCILDEAISRREIYKEVFLVLVVHIYLEMFVGPDQIILNGPPHDGNDMGDASRLHGVPAAQCVEAVAECKLRCPDSTLLCSTGKTLTHPPMNRLPAPGTLSSQPIC